MEGLRGIAILLVFFTHYAEFNPPAADSSHITLWLHKFVLRAGLSGVDLFFVLSGYLIYGSIIRRPIQLSEYARRRFKRIYPVFIFVLLLYIALFIAIPAKSKFSGNLEQDAYLVALNLLLLPLLPFLGGAPTIINATWSLAYEIFYYACAPVVIYALNLRRFSPGTRFLIISFVSCIGFIAFHQFGGNDRAMMFLAGVLLYDLQAAPRKPRLPNWSGAVALVIGVTLLGLLYDSSGFPTGALFVLFTIVCIDAFTPDSSFGRWLSSRPLRQLGNISYSFYLIHGLLLQAFLTGVNKLLPNTDFYIQIVPSLIFSTAGSLLVYLFIEKPLSLNQKRPDISDASTRVQGVAGPN